MQPTMTIGVVGLWHLGSVIAASWATLGHRVIGVADDAAAAHAMMQGTMPLYEPQLAESIGTAIQADRFVCTADPAALRQCQVVFLAYDTPVREDDTADIPFLQERLQRILPHLAPQSILVVSSQVPVGFCRQLQAQCGDRIAVVYSPENLRLGEAIACYLRPGHVVFGGQSAAAIEQLQQLFTPMQAQVLAMNWESAEMCKHGINAFLGMSVTFANQFADACAHTGANYQEVVQGLRADPRIGQRAYLQPGIGFSGGTLARDLVVLSHLDAQPQAHLPFPLFGQLLDYNRSRYLAVCARAEKILGTLAGKTVAMYGMTYKAGTSTLRRSLPLAVAEAFVARGARVSAYDPKADWSEITVPHGITPCTTPDAASAAADIAIVLTAWPEFTTTDFSALGTQLASKTIVDVYNTLREQRARCGECGVAVLDLAGR